LGGYQERRPFFNKSMSWKKYLIQRHPEIIDGNYLKNNESVKSFIDNEQIKECERNLRFHVGMAFIFAAGFLVVIGGIYLIWKI